MDPGDIKDIGPAGKAASIDCLIKAIRIIQTKRLPSAMLKSQRQARCEESRVLRNRSPWCGKFPRLVRSVQLKRRQGRLGDTWFLDEVFVTINGQRQYLWRAVDQDGDFDILVQPSSGRFVQPRRFIRRLLKSQRQEPVRLVIDKLGTLPCRPSVTSCRWSPMTRGVKRTIAPKPRINPRDGHCQVADERAFFSLGAERPSLGQQAHVTSSH